MRRIVRAPTGILVAAVVLGVATVQADHVKPGFNLFSVEQDVEIGKQSAVEAERQLPLLRQPSVDRYLNDLVQNLARHTSGPRYPYSIRAVNASEINAMSLPGGPMYVHRGLIEAARSEAELTGVLAHEMAHVVLRHGTHQASKAYLGQAGIGLLGGILGKGGDNTGQIIGAIGGLGLNAVFLKHSRNDEYQADSVGAEIMAKAGYDPAAMASFFEILRKQQGRDPGKLQQFFSSHPPSADRETRIRQQAKSLRVAQRGETGGFQRVKADLGGVPRPVAGPTPLRQAPQGGSQPSRAGGQIQFEPPSSRLARFEQRNGFFGIDYPDNWRPHESQQGVGVTIVPNGGVVDVGSGNQAIVNGVIVNHYDPFEAGTKARGGNLEQATDDVLRQITRANSYLRAGAKRRERIDNAAGYSIALSGTSPVTREEERVILVTRELTDGHVLYAVLIAPGRGYDSFAPVFTRMVRSLRIDDQAAHRIPGN